METVTDVVVDEQAVERIVKKIRTRKPERRKDYAYIAGRNWAIDVVKRREAAPRIAQRKLAKQVAELERKLAVIEEERLKTRCLEEFERVVLRLQPSLSESQHRMLAVVRAAVFDGWDRETMIAVFEGSKDCVHQWKRRGVKLLWPHISKEFHNFLDVMAP